ncbi:piggyBac transposable element-derived protein 4-like [Portunus trituberculatus]|uniref:piggyBac transposable element-derived protein 4-like n=1 Tax=Portunus trituberculatus TaxID=210409 RepID=UPI001E1CE8A6|nr:piggyBac transposable element-derived protein 4-like [Portunus trituberculatus]
MYVWLAHTMLMPHVKKHKAQDYWSKDELIHTPIFGKYMGRDRYLSIYKFLHFATNMGPVPNDRLYKVRYLISLLQEKMRRFFKPYQKLVIDESLVLFRGRLNFIQYIPSKHHCFGLKFFVLCDCKTGYILDFVIYTGTDVDIQETGPHGFSGAVVKTLLDKHFKRNHILYTDNYYTSPALTQFLLREEKGTCGTVRANRKHWPAFRATSRGQVQKKESGPMLAMQWMDRHPVNMLSTMHTGDLQDSGKVDHNTGEPVKKPDAVIDYNVNMRLVDKSNMMVSEIDSLRKTRTWYKKVFLHLVDVMVLNSHILYKQLSGNTKLSLRCFEKELVRQLLSRFGTITGKPEGPRQMLLTDRLHSVDFNKTHRLTLNPRLASGRTPFRSCIVCKHTAHREQRRVETRYHCSSCNVALCAVDCFSDFHSEEQY